jgi:hypothetical protein
MFPQPESGHDGADHKAELADRGDDACVPLSHKTSQNTFGKVMMGRRGLGAIKCPGGFINQDNIRERAANVDPNPHTYLLDASRVAFRFG